MLNKHAMLTDWITKEVTYTLHKDPQAKAHPPPPSTVPHLHMYSH